MVQIFQKRKTFGARRLLKEILLNKRYFERSLKETIASHQNGKATWERFYFVFLLFPLPWLRMRRLAKSRFKSQWSGEKTLAELN